QAPDHRCTLLGAVPSATNRNAAPPRKPRIAGVTLASYPGTILAPPHSGDPPRVGRDPQAADFPRRFRPISQTERLRWESHRERPSPRIADRGHDLDHLLPVCNLAGHCPQPTRLAGEPSGVWTSGERASAALVGSHRRALDRDRRCHRVALYFRL